MESQGSPVSPEQLREAIVLVRINAHGWGVDRKLDDDEYETAAATELTAASKKLTQDARYKVIRQIARAADRWLEEREVGKRKRDPKSKERAPRSRFKFGRSVHAVPVALIEDVVEYLEAVRGEYERAADEFVAALPEIKEAAKRSKEDGGLGILYNESDWPSAEEIRAKYEFEWDIFDQTVPSERPGISSRTVALAADKARRKWEDAAEQIEAGLYTELTKLVAKLSERLTEDTDTGKTRSFHASTVERLRSFLELLPSRNVTGNGKLAEVAERCSALLSGTDAQAIRNSDSLKGMLREGLAAVATELAETSTVGARRFNFDRASGF